MPLFDRIVMVDWSAAAAPTLGRDSIWIGEEGTVTFNPPTRAAAIDRLREAARAAVARGQRVLIGFDFAFGYPFGAAARFGGGWRGVWRWLSERVRDGRDNANDRFAVAADFNARFPECEGPLWGHPPGWDVAGVGARKPANLPMGVAERRLVERLVPRASPTWKLAYTGAVGSQTILGIAALERWRADPEFSNDVAVWPFDTAFAGAFDRPVVLAEIYPSLFDVESRDGEVRDAAQVRTLADGFAALDRNGALLPYLDGPSDDEARRIALAEEGWIMGVGDRPLALA